MILVPVIPNLIWNPSRPKVRLFGDSRLSGNDVLNDTNMR